MRSIYRGGLIALLLVAGVSVASAGPVITYDADTGTAEPVRRTQT